MKIAVTYENGEIFGHFGHTKQFKVYETENGKIISSKVVDTNGSGHGALAGMLSALNIDVLICGGIGGGAPCPLPFVSITFDESILPFSVSYTLNCFVCPKCPKISPFS